MITSGAVEAAALVRAQAEHAEWSAIIAEVEAEEAQIRADRSTTPMYRYQAERAVRLDLAQRLHVSEQAIWRICEQGSRLRDRAPLAWAGFASGQLDARKASVVAAAVARCEHPESVAELDAVVVDYASGHTVAELRRWLDRVVEKLEPPTLEEFEVERAERRVEITHGETGMSWINAHVPSVAAVAIGARLRAAAKALDDPGRTREQKQADLFTSWLTNATGTESDVTAEIAVVVEAEALAGVTDTPARLDGGEAIAPVSWIIDLAESESTLWTRLLTDPAGHVLDVTRLGYQPPATLRHAIEWRDQRCRINGCETRAENTDLDHAIPYDAGGPTNGENLRCLCRRHHRMKGHHLLPASAFSPPEVHLTRLPAPPIQFEYVPAA